MHRHYGMLLGVNRPWEVGEVELSVAARQVRIRLDWQWGAKPECPECGRACSIYDSAPERRWRHFDTMQFETKIQARVPRVNCADHGIRTMSVPGAAPAGRLTLMFERLAIEVLRASASVAQGCQLLRISGGTAHQIMERAVERGLDRRELDALVPLGLDEKSFKRGQSSITLLTDLDESRVLDVEEGRTQTAAIGVWMGLRPEQRAGVEAVAVDLWEPFLQATRQQAPQADIVHDGYHVSAYLNQAVDEVRRREHRELQARGEDTLKGTRQLWLYDPRNLSSEPSKEFSKLKDLNLKVARAWAAKELFTKFWDDASVGWARRFFKDGYGWVSRSRLKPLIRAAQLIKRPLENLLTYLKHHLTNAVTEGLNSRIQSLKAAARGFRNFDHYRIRILCFCGKLDLYPR